jgi:hypothetical protein
MYYEIVFYFATSKKRRIRAKYLLKPVHRMDLAAPTKLPVCFA